MNLSIHIDESKLTRVSGLMRIDDPSRLVETLLDEVLERQEAAERLASLAGTMPDLELPPRRRGERLE